VNVARLLGLAEDEFATVSQQRERADLLDEGLREWIGGLATDEALRKLADAEVVASRIFSVQDIVDDPTYAELGDIITVSDHELGPVRMQGVIPRLAQHPGEVWRTGAPLGADNVDVLGRWLGLDDDAIGQLQAEDVVSSPASEE
jgi:formyl-CoA transferase